MGSFHLSSLFTLKKILLCTRISRSVIRKCCTENNSDIMELKQVNKRLQSIAPTTLADSWDNVGLLVEPSPPLTISTMFLTNDLTEPVMEEAIEKKANLILSYHPPIFSALKCLTQRTWKERIIVKCLENKIAVYSPHTTYDAVKDGLTDWLISPFAGKVEPIQQRTDSCFPTLGKHRAELLLTVENMDSVLKQVRDINGVEVTVSQCSDGSTHRVQCCCTDKGLVRLVDTLKPYDDARNSLEIMSLQKPPLPDHGFGRISKLENCTTLGEAVNRVKSHLILRNLRLALGNGCNNDSKVKTVAVCAGSGAQILRGIEADLYITGEMSHHEVLDATSRGTSVILCDHSNSERGYLTVLQQRLNTLFENKINIIVSTVDKDPLDIV